MAVPPTPSPLRNPPRASFVARPPRPDARSLYSAHALREMRTYLRLRMLELREADLDRARLVIEHRLSVDQLLDPPGTSAETSVASPR